VEPDPGGREAQSGSQQGEGRLREAQGRLRFPFAPSVYKARLEDFYYYQDRLDIPLYRALFLINEQIAQGGRAR
jgi:hypothetical protein